MNLFKRFYEQALDDGAAGGSEGAADETSAEDEQRARQLGWVPQDEFQGPPERWRPAKEFLERGEEITPILKANNRRLHQQLTAQQQETAALREQIAQQNEILNALKESNAEIMRDRRENQIRDLTSQIAAAREADDVALESRLQARLTNLTRDSEEDDDEEREQRGRRGTREEPRRPQVPNYQTAEWWITWNEENPWYAEDADRRFLADAVSQRLRADPQNAHLKERAFMDKVTQEVARLTGRQQQSSAGRAKVESGSERGGGGGGSDVSGWNDLPAEAKAACNRREKQLVGTRPGQFKTQKEYRAYYARTYFRGESR